MKLSRSFICATTGLVLLCGAAGGCKRKADVQKEEEKPTRETPAQIDENADEAKPATMPNEKQASPTSDSATEADAGDDASAKCAGEPNPCVTDTLFEILGMITEYNGRGNSLHGLPEEVVDAFYYDERAAADLLKSRISTYEKEVGLRFGVEQKEGDVIELRSKSLSGIVNSFYKKSEGRPAYTLDPAVLKKASDAQKKRYIEGVYARFGVKSPRAESVIRLTNAFHKAETVVQTLKDLGCPEAEVHGTATIPANQYIRFVPTDALKALLEIEEVPTEAEMQKICPPCFNP